MVHRLSRLVHSDDGAAALLTVILTSVVFIGLCALVVDLGMARDTRRQAQNAADASALAAGNVLYLSGTADIASAIIAAKAYALTNYGVTEADWALCTDASALAFTPDSPDGHLPNTCISFDSATAPASIRVNIPVRQVQTPFAQIWGVSKVPVGASAQMALVPGGRAQCGLCVIGPGSHNLQNGKITVNGASVAINGTLSTNPQNWIKVTGTGSAIDLEASSDGGCNCAPAALKNQAHIVDPLINLIMPDYSALTAKSNSCTDGPGIYVSLEACPGGMRPGLYVLTGTTSLHGNSFIVANGVTLDFLCSTSGVPGPCKAGQSVGGLSFSGNAYINITAPPSGQPNQGLAIVADRSYTTLFSFVGNGASSTSGTIYAASGMLKHNGNGFSGSHDSLIDIGDFDFRGSPSEVVATYTQSANVAIDASDMHLSQ